MRSHQRWFGVIALAALGCSAVEDERAPPAAGPTSETVEHIDAGQLCLYAYDVPLVGWDEPQRLQMGSVLHVQVTAPECLSSSCDVMRMADCTVTHEQDHIIVESHLTYKALDARMCTLDCGRLTARCRSAPLREASYQLVFGEQIRELSVPSTIFPCGGAMSPSR